MRKRWFGGTHLLRQGRCSLAGYVYLLTACTRDRLPLFADLYLARVVVSTFQEAQAEGLVKSIAYVVMPDHFHWLVRLGAASDLSGLMHCVKGRSSIQINRLTDRAGPVWQDSFHDRGIRRGEDLRAAARYIVANPLRAGLVEDIGQWPHWDAVWLEGGDEGDAMDP